MEIAELEIRVATEKAEAGQKRLQVELDKTGKLLDRVMASGAPTSAQLARLGGDSARAAAAMRQAAQEAVSLASATARQQVAAGQAAAAVKTLQAAIDTEGASTKSLIALETQLINARRQVAVEAQRQTAATATLANATETASTVAMRQRAAIQATRQGMVGLRSSVMLLGMQAFPQLSTAILGSTAAMQGLRAASAASGLAMRSLAGPAVAAAAGVVALVKAFEAFSEMRAAEAEAVASRQGLIETQVENANRLVPLLRKAAAAGAITADEAERLTTNLAGSAGNADAMAKALRAAGAVVKKMNAEENFEKFLETSSEQLLSRPAQAAAAAFRELDEMVSKGTALAVAAGRDSQVVLDIANKLGKQINAELARIEELQALQSRLVKGGTLTRGSEGGAAGGFGAGATVTLNPPMTRELDAARAEMRAAGTVEAVEQAAAKINIITQEMARKMEFNLMKPLESFTTGWHQAVQSFGSTSQRVAAVGAGLANSLDQNITDGLMGIIDGTKSVKQAFSEMASAIVQDLIRVMVQQLIVRSALSAFGGGGAAVGHSGGVVGGPMPTREVDPSAFVGASRYQSGGFAGDEVPVVAHRGEVILSEDDTASALAGGRDKSPRIDIVNLTDPRMVSDFLNANPSAIINVVTKNRSQFKAALGVTS